MAKDTRLYARFDIGMDEHSKVITLSDEAFRALFESTFYSRRQLTDGFLDERVVLRKWGEKVAEELSSNDNFKPSWVKVDGGWKIHDFAEHQTTTADIQAKREAGRKGGIAKASKGLAGATKVLKQKGSNTLAKTETETETYKNSSSEIANALPRPDVENLLDSFDENMESIGAKKPARSKANINAMRLLLDKDGYSSEQVLWIMNWASSDEFWRTNILSPSKLRTQFEQLKLKAGINPATPKPLKRFDL